MHTAIYSSYPVMAMAHGIPSLNEPIIRFLCTTLRRGLSAISDALIFKLDPDLLTWEVLEIQSFRIFTFAQPLYSGEIPFAWSAFPPVVFANSNKIVVYVVGKYNVLILGITCKNICSSSVPSQTAQKLNGSNT